MNTSDSRILGTQKWKAKSRKILRRDKYIDQYIFRTTGRVIPATLVHHILPRDKFPQYTFEDWNLISVSYDTHMKILHNPYSGELTKKGQQLLMETAYMNGIKLNEMVLVVGMPESGKSTYVKKHLGEGLAYDLDYIAAAFRLKKPKEEYHESSRVMANRLLKGFIVEAPKYNSQVFIIRTAPYENELYDINPDRLVICKGGYMKKLENKYEIDIDECIERIKNCEEYAKLNNIPIEYVTN